MLCLCHSGTAIFTLQIRACGNAIVLFVGVEYPILVFFNHMLFYYLINAKIFSFDTFMKRAAQEGLPICRIKPLN